MPLNPGDLRDLISLERDHVTREKGAEVRTSETYALHVPCKIEYLSGNELWKAKQVDAEVNVRVTLRYRTDVLAAHRAIDQLDLKTLEIKAVIPDRIRRESVILECKG